MSEQRSMNSKQLEERTCPHCGTTCIVTDDGDGGERWDSLSDAENSARWDVTWEQFLIMAGQRMDEAGVPRQSPGGGVPGLYLRLDLWADEMRSLKAELAALGARKGELTDYAQLHAPGEAWRRPTTVSLSLESFNHLLRERDSLTQSLAQMAKHAEHLATIVDSNRFPSTAAELLADTRAERDAARDDLARISDVIERHALGALGRHLTADEIIAEIAQRGRDLDSAKEKLEE